MKRHYLHPEWRMMSDIDFIIDKENLDAAEYVMKKFDKTYLNKLCNIDNIDGLITNEILNLFSLRFWK